MNGQDLVTEAMNLCGEVVSGLRELGNQQGDPVARELEAALKDLEALRKRPTLRTKNGTNKAFPVKDAAEHLQEAFEDAADDPEEFRAMADEFISAVGTLKESMKGRTVIMT